MAATYNPNVFNVQNERQAKNIILTPEGQSTDERWEKETPFLVSDINQLMNLEKDSLIVDFGCGIGRVSRELIKLHGCRVIGVDISLSMQVLGLQYVHDSRFSVLTPDLIRQMVKSGLRVDACFSIWVLQHCPNVEQEIELIKSLLKPGGCFYILNNNMPAIPTDKGWINNKVDIKPMLEEHFSEVSYSMIPQEYVSEVVHEHSFIAKLKK